ncbi:hypothetical protein [Pseudomonas sp. NW5]|uniref:hypothetical protein n=1 Tax=Pseudomonas sp. NW5 TaxID=2934934 RepID=UPI002022634F|nr:hypothetical protein [Pseudomonas sp. NW5]MCL7461850.1 hypothetical protein [Pseudomonas sp. NW5]
MPSRDKKKLPFDSEDALLFVPSSALLADLGKGLGQVAARLPSISELLALFESGAAGVDEPIGFETGHPIGHEPGQLRHELPTVIGVVGNQRSERLGALDFDGV